MDRKKRQNPFDRFLIAKYKNCNKNYITNCRSRNKKKRKPNAHETILNLEAIKKRSNEERCLKINKNLLPLTGQAIVCSLGVHLNSFCCIAIASKRQFNGNLNDMCFVFACAHCVCVRLSVFFTSS